MSKEDLLAHWLTSGLITDKKLIASFKEIKRENFVLSEDKSRAYEDIALPIGYASTISQPSTIMIMLQALHLQERQKILEIGTGSGYTAALMSKVSESHSLIYSLDIVPALLAFAKRNLKKEHIPNVKLFRKDGKKGLSEEAPFDRILINAACTTLPKNLLTQLKTHGILVAPVGLEHHQKMIKLTKTNKERLKEESLGDFVFVRLQ